MEKLGEEACGVAKEVQVLWTEERRTLTLCSEPVLEYTLSWPRVEGAGLGLYIADHFMKEMEGALRVENGERGLRVSVLIRLSGAA